MGVIGWAAGWKEMLSKVHGRQIHLFQVYLHSAIFKLLDEIWMAHLNTSLLSIVIEISEAQAHGKYFPDTVWTS